MLMDHFKAHIRKAYPNMYHFLTYADNYAVGYFRKQGFSKEISLDRSVWAGYIKDYEGGTIMQCTMLPKVDYTQTRDIIAKQREAILEKIRERSKSHVVYDGLTDVWDTTNGPLDPKQVPGLSACLCLRFLAGILTVCAGESGWTPAMAVLYVLRSPPSRAILFSDICYPSVRANARSPEHAAMEKLLSELQGHTLAFAFQKPVNPDEVPDYYDVIKEPMGASLPPHTAACA